ncbi:hypothetical protein GLOTRDRAFT_123164 [Gloeophyllum trabeum ATCC 11539]|uniref:t-SNARE coiled-coil homology domain-containing protein n=1 Tax=Gloeophyllum trabeum (strain ATCC 11539 / FP-39264 / Madison 617) TaxID=670483 RepID=S7PVS4_GLOTA|nr:uncharacterized protein GLOTRDRAFT_123164 [Gloeophyllum trabeum ATCC 11539]EPQ51613.1 hypothetical protein GLOTRDRAFT_123164 [Gloeophyllum trabeum ATCC 11539]
MSLAKLTSLSTQTLSLLLERQRLQTLSSTSTHNAKLGQITRNLNQLRNGILELEKNEGGRTEAVRLLRSQYERMRGMLGEDAAGVESLQDDPSPFPSPAPAAPRSPSPRNDSVKVTQFAPYTDDPEGGPPNRYQDEEPQVILQTQRRLIDDQDAQLDVLSSSINRQHHLSLQINSELDSHVGLLEELDTDLDRTEGRLNGARRSLDRVAKGAKENSSTVIIAILILVLLLLIIVFKT